MNKVIFWAIVFFVVWQFLRHSALVRGRHSREESEAHPPERMVACHRCQLYLPEKECVVVDDRFYCSAACHQGPGYGGARKGQC